MVTIYYNIWSASRHGGHDDQPGTLSTPQLIIQQAGQMVVASELT